MASSSSKRRRSYDVFLSFRGTDIRKAFLGHLYETLTENGFNTYRDTEELRMGEQISSALMKAIEESRIAIVVFSKDYASSTWCLDELAKIMECKDQNDLIVIPVFYKVDPREVRTPRDQQSYAQAMAKHVVKFEKEPEKVKRWKKALFDAGELSGQHVTDDTCEAGVIRHIVQEISTQLNRTPLQVPKYLVGIDSRVEELKARLNLQSKDSVLVVVLWGQGGIGKTTLATATYNTVFREFQGSSFLERVKENSEDLAPLQKQLLSDVLPNEISTSFGVRRGSQLIQERLTNKRLLIILDDVDDEGQLNALVGDCKWLCEGSRVIITTRNKGLLKSQEAWYIHEVEALKATEASELLRMHAFPRNQQIKIKSDLVDSVLKYAQGLPLALEVVGSSLCNAGEEEWESTLLKLAQSPTKKINDVLRVGFDKLDKNEEEIFLDIACFFKGWATSTIKKILDGCGFGAAIGIRILIERSLIREVGGTLKMHDLIQLMGKDIVEEKSHNPVQRSRLWLYGDVCNVLSGSAETYEVKAIVLKLREPEEMEIDPHALKNMKELRLLILHNVRNSSQVSIYLPNKLRWLEWPRCASTLRFSPGRKELVGLDLRKSEIGEVQEQFEDFKKLKFINLSECQWLVHMPNLSFTPDLEELNLSECKNLEGVHESVTRLRRLRSLNLSGCSPLLSLPDVLQSKDLESLALAYCPKVQRFPIIPNNTKCLRELDLEGTSIEELPASVGILFYLKRMNLTNCEELSILPSSIYQLQNLEKLELGGCSKLIKFPKKEEIESAPHMKTGFPKLELLCLRNCNLSEVEFLENPLCFASLKQLSLEGNNFTSLPACRHLHNLIWLHVSQNNQLQEIGDIPRKLRETYADDCKSLSKISFDIGDLERISLGSCDKLVGNVPGIYDLFEFERACLKEGFNEVLLPGGEMPEWLIPNDDGYISFMASEDLLFKKFLGLAVCAVVKVKEGERFANLGMTTNILAPNGGDKDFYWDSDHVWLNYCGPIKRLWNIVRSDPYEWRCFKFIVRASPNGIVKKCGFRLICKPLENNREVFLQHNPLLNPRLLYEVGHEENQLSTAKEISSEMEDLQERETSREEDSSSKDDSSMAGISIQELRYSLIHPDYRNVRPGGEMPEEFVPVKDGTISFKASQNLYDKILGLALCAILGVEDGEKEVSFCIVPYINGQRRNALSGTLGSFDSDQIWIQYLRSNVLWGLLEGGVDFGQFGERCLQFSLQIEVSGGTMKKLGYVMRCRQLEDDLKFECEDNKLVNLASLLEDCHEPEDYSHFPSEFPKFWQHFPREYLRKCHMHIEEPEASDGDGEPDGCGVLLSFICKSFTDFTASFRFCTSLMGIL